MKFVLLVLAILQTINIVLADTTSSTVTPKTTSTIADITSTSLPTTASTCEDDPNVNCAKLKPQCSDPRYDELMKRYCPKTCDRCGESGTTKGTCYDNSTECAVWDANGFCNSTFYTEPIKKQYCAKTCDLC
ncbi:shTK domain protein [Ostertagia ostertagi]